MITKECTKCYVEKPLEDYHNLKTGKYGKCSYCKECAKNWQKEWRDENKDHVQKRVNKYYSKRRKEDKSWYFSEMLRNQVRRYIINKKGKKTEEILGETFYNVRKYIEEQFVDGMNWDNYGEWHIDHIIPLSSGINREEYIKLNHYTNLQPLWAKDNMQKKDKLDWQKE